MKETDPLLTKPTAFPSMRTLLTEGVVLSNSGSTARDYLALERTYLAWIRTSLSLGGVGLALLKWEGIVNVAGYLVFGLGLFALVASTVRYFRVMQQLSVQKFEPNVHSVLSVVIVMALVLIVLLLLHLMHEL